MLKIYLQSQNFYPRNLCMHQIVCYSQLLISEDILRADNSRNASAQTKIEKYTRAWLGLGLGHCTDAIFSA